MFVDLTFCAGRKDHLPGVNRRHSWQAALLRFLSGYVGWPRSAHDAAKRSVWCNGVATVKTAAHDDFAVGEYHCAVRGITI